VKLPRPPFLRRRVAAGGLPPAPTALVLLLLRPHLLDAPMLARLASRALDQPVAAADIERRRVADGWQVFLLRAGGWPLAVHNAAHPYPDAAARADAPGHRAWQSVDAMRDPPGDGLPGVYALLGRLAAALAMSDCLAVRAPALGAARAWDDGLRARLAAGEAWDALRPG
jgi:hypothetical protein